MARRRNSSKNSHTITVVLIHHRFILLFLFITLLHLSNVNMLRTMVSEGNRRSVTTSTCGGELGCKCNKDDECLVVDSRCYENKCSCYPYYAPYNSTTCLQSTMLGFECMVNEQCSKKVAYSSCIGGICRCAAGYLQYRRHTCLPGAKLGEICYSDLHCRLSSPNTQCEFLIAGLFGTCVCNPTSSLRQSSSSDTTCIPSSMSSNTISKYNQQYSNVNESTMDIIDGQLYKSPPATKNNHTQSTIIHNHKHNNMDKVKKKTWNKNTTRKPTKTNKKPTTTTVTIDKNDDDRKWNRVESTTEYDDKQGMHVNKPSNMHLSAFNIHDVNLTKYWDSKIPTKENVKSSSASYAYSHTVDQQNSSVSLGYPCINDDQCTRTDKNSKCISGVCDCVARRTKLENACSAKNRGCHRGTFQCRSSGICISWFFVCDGRKDCEDGSDEDCKDKNVCPEHSFTCSSTATTAVCVSLATRCDGIKDCPGGEDEHNCISGKTKKNCPATTFECGDGRCLPEYEYCNAVISCSDGSDEPSYACTANWNTSSRNIGYCPFRCKNGRCRSSAVVCSGRDGCGDNSDETKCSICKCPEIRKS